MASKRIIRCSNCGVFNTDEDYCTNCNLLLSEKIKYQKKLKKIKQEAIDEVIYNRENPNFVERLKKHPFFLFRFIGWILYAGYAVVSTVGAGIAWLIATLAT